MIPVEEARARILAALSPVGVETVALSESLGRVIAQPVTARRLQPPKDLSAMDGYALRFADIGTLPVTLTVIAEVPAGGSFDGTVPAGSCVRIFTGGPLPAGTDTIVIQENTEADEAAGTVTILEGSPEGRHVRRAGLDFAPGDILVDAGKRLSARDIGLAAAGNTPWVTVYRKPRVAILSTGDEISLPGDPIGPNQIVSSNGPALAAAVAAAGGIPTLLPIAPDDAESLQALARNAAGHDLLLTTGGASVGKHDLVGSALAETGLELDFWKIAMRPGKPLMFGSFAGMPMLGLPGNPVSALVCFLLFGRPALARLAGATDTGITFTPARLGSALPENDRREDYLRADLHRDESGQLIATPTQRQDSSMMSTLSHAGGLVRRPPHAPAADVGAPVEVLVFPEGF